MATETREVIFKLKIDTKESEANLKSLTGTQQQTTEATKQQTEAQKKSKQVIEAESDSIAKLREENKKLTAERNSISTATAEGVIRIKALNDQIDANNAKIKDNVDAYTKQKINIGNYKGALDKLVPGLGATADGFTAMTRTAMTFIATPIGAIIGALGLAIGALISYFKGSEEGQDKLNKIMTIGSTIMEKVMDVVEGLGEMIFNAFSNPKEAILELVDLIKTNLVNRFKALGEIIQGVLDLDFERIGNGVLQLGTGVEDVIGKITNLAKEVVATVKVAIDEGAALADRAVQIRTLERQQQIDSAKTALEVAKLKEQYVKEEGLNRRVYLEEAIALEQKLADKSVTLAALKLTQAKEDARINGETTEAKQKVVDAEVALINAQAERYQATLRFEKQLESLRDKEEAEAQRRAEAEQKRRDEEEERQARELANRVARLEAWNTQYLNIQKKNKKDAEKIQKEEEKQREESIKNVTGLLKDAADVFKEHTIAYKATATAETTISTWSAAQQAFERQLEIPGPFPMVRAIASAAVAVAQGLARVAKIVAIGFAEGGAVSGKRIGWGDGAAISRDNGDNLLATVRVGEVILNERQQRALGGAKTFARIGVPGFAAGGLVNETRLALDSLDEVQRLTDLTNAVLNMPRQVLVLQDFEAKQVGVQDAQTIATVVQ
jgi:hypothetical protein